MDKILLVGGAGFIGSAICRRLIDRGIHPIVLDTLTQYTPKLVPDNMRITALKKRFEGIENKIIFIRGNAANYSEIYSALKKHRPKAVIHLGGISIASSSNEYIEEAIESSLIATTCIIRAINDIDPTIRFIFTSSSTVYGNFQYSPADEEHPTNAKGVYAGIKLAGENITKSFCKQFNIPFVIIRPQAVYGPTDTNRRVLQKFIEAAINNESLIVNDPTTAIDFTYIDDAAEGFVLAALSKNAENKTFNLSAGKARTLQEAVNIIKKYFPNMKINITEADNTLPRRGPMDIKKAKKFLSFEPKYTLEEGIENYISYLRENRLL